MFGLVIYVGGCLIVAALVTFVHSMFRPVASKGDSRSWRVLAAVFVLSITGPYGYVEVLTRSFGKTMKSAIEQGMIDAGIKGPMDYYKVTSYGGDTARIVAVAEEKQAWGGSDRPVVAMTLKKDGKFWHTASFDVIFSDRLNRDRSTLPPFW